MRCMVNVPSATTGPSRRTPVYIHLHEPESFSTGVQAVAAVSLNRNSTRPPIENDSGFTLPT